MKLTTAITGKIVLIALALIFTGPSEAISAKRLTAQSKSFAAPVVRTVVESTVSSYVQPAESPQASNNALIDEQINWQVISSGGLMNGRSADYIHSGSINQTAIGSGLSGALIVKHGFWQTPPNSAISCCDTPGDANGDGQANVGDAVFIITYVFKGGAPPECMLKGDANGDCYVNVADAVVMVVFCFKNGVTPVCGCDRE